MARETTKELGGRKSQGVMSRPYDKTRPEEVAPEMRGALDRARAALSVGEFGRDLAAEVAFDDNGEVGLRRSQYVRSCFRRFRSLRANLVSSVSQPMRPNFMSVLGQRARDLGLSGAQTRAILARGTEYHVLLRRIRETERAAAECSRERGSALDVRGRTGVALRRLLPVSAAPNPSDAVLPCFPGPPGSLLPAHQQVPSLHDLDCPLGFVMESRPFRETDGGKNPHAKTERKTGNF